MREKPQNALPIPKYYERTVKIKTAASVIYEKIVYLRMARKLNELCNKLTLVTQTKLNGKLETFSEMKIFVEKIISRKFSCGF